jgi:Zn-dependent protease
VKWSWRIGHVFGIELHIHATFLLAVAWGAITGYREGGTAGAAASGVVFILAVFASVVLHELGHALTARRFGVGTRDIVLLPIGGVARLERMPEEPRQELVIALAGPAVTAVIVGVLYAVQRLTGASPNVRAILASGSWTAQLMVANVTLLVFNLLPAFPMDGGRVLRALLAMRMDYVRATNVAAALGKVFALLFGIVGYFWLNNPLLAVIALFVWMGAAAEAQMIETRSALGGVPVHRVMISDMRTLSPGDPLALAVDFILAGFQQDFPVVAEGRVVGVLTRAELLKSLAQHGRDATVAEVMQRDFQTTEPWESLDRAFARLQGCRCQTLPVARGGELVGVLTTDNVGEYLMVQAALRGRA